MHTCLVTPQNGHALTINKPDIDNHNKVTYNNQHGSYTLTGRV